MSASGPSSIRVTIDGKKVTLSEKEVQQFDRAIAYIERNPQNKAKVTSKLGPRLKAKYNAYIDYRSEKHFANAAQGNQKLQELCEKQDAVGADLDRLRSEQNELAVEIETRNKAIIYSRNKCNAEIMGQAEAITYKDEKGVEKPFFEGNTEEEKRNFIEGLELIRETKLRNTLG